MLEWPRSAWITRTSVPSSSRCVANPWRNECSVTFFLNPISVIATRSTFLTASLLTGVPVRLLGNRYGPRGLASAQYRRSTWSSFGLRRTRRSLACFAPRIWSTIRSLSMSCTLSRRASEIRNPAP